MSLIDPIKYIIKDLSLNIDINTKVSSTNDENIEGTIPGLLSVPRIFLETLKMWDKEDNDCYGITIAKQRFGSGKSPIDQTVEFAMEFICWSNRGESEHNLWELWSVIDAKYHDQHDYRIGYDETLGSCSITDNGQGSGGNVINNKTACESQLVLGETDQFGVWTDDQEQAQTPLMIMHSNRFQEPSFELRFGSTSGSAVARLSSAQKLRLSSLSSIYNFVGWEKPYRIPQPLV